MSEKLDTSALSKQVPDYVRFEMYNTPNRLVKLESYEENFAEQPRYSEAGKHQQQHRSQDTPKNWSHFDKVYKVDQNNITSLGIMGDVLEHVPRQVPDTRKKLFVGTQTNQQHAIGVVGDSPASMVESYQQNSHQFRRVH